jgi:hypothetical protein
MSGGEKHLEPELVGKCKNSGSTVKDEGEMDEGGENENAKKRISNRVGN